MVQLLVDLTAVSNMLRGQHFLIFLLFSFSAQVLDKEIKISILEVETISA